MKIIGFYKDYTLVECGGVYSVVDMTDRRNKKILFKSLTEEGASKYFIMLVAGFINELGEAV